jgi:hypothetical protein
VGEGLCNQIEKEVTSISWRERSSMESVSTNRMFIERYANCGLVDDI